MIGLIFAVFFGTLLIGVPIGIGVAIAAIVAIVVNPSLPLSFEYVYRVMVTSLDSTTLLAVPLFVLSGNLMAEGKLSEKLYNFFSYFIGDKVGGLPIAAIVTCLFYGAISGSAPGTVAAVGAMTIPLLIKLGYDKGFVVGMIAAAGGLGVIIPPSLPFIMYGLTAQASVGNLFIAGIIPGIIIAIIMSVYTYFYCKRKGEKRELVRAHAEEIRSRGLWNIFKDSFWALLAPVIILGGIYTGITTPTEAAVVSVVYSLIVSIFVYKTMTLKSLIPVTNATIRGVAPTMLVVAGATTFGRVLTMMQVPQSIAMTLTTVFTSKVALLLAINVFLLFVGMIMETMAAILICTPIFLPVVTAIGMDPIQFGVIMIVNLAIGFITPPVGINLYVSSNMTGVPVLTVARRALPYIACLLVALLMFTFIPELSLLLL